MISVITSLSMIFSTGFSIIMSIGTYTYLGCGTGFSTYTSIILSTNFWLTIGFSVMAFTLMFLV